MSRLESAIEAATQRKQAAFGDMSGFVLGEEVQQRAVFSGFDIEYEELVELQEKVGYYFCTLTPHVPLRPLFSSCWIEGLLLGLMLSLPPADTGGTDAPGSVEGEP